MLINVELLYRQIDGVTANGVLITRGTVVVTPVNRRDSGSGEVTTMPKSFAVGATAALESGEYQFTLVVPNGDGAGGEYTTSAVRLVPAAYPVGVTSIQVDDLEEVTPTPPSGPPEGWQAYVDEQFAALNAAIAGIEGQTPVGSGPGGAFIALDVTDTSDVGRSVMVAGGTSGTLASRQATARAAVLAAADAEVAKLTGAQTIAGVKTFSDSPIVPTPTTSGQAATKGYADSVASSGTPDADGSTKGKVQLAGDLGGTAASPTVVAVQGVAVSGTDPTTGQVLSATSTSAAAWVTPTLIGAVTVSGTPTAGQAIVASSGTAASWAVPTTAVDEIADVPGLQTALDGKAAAGIAGLPKCVPLYAVKDPTSGFWPASWNTDGSPVYTGGSASAGVRPTADADRHVIWVGAAPFPPIVSSGTAGMRNNVDYQGIH